MNELFIRHTIYKKMVRYLILGYTKENRFLETLVGYCRTCDNIRSGELHLNLGYFNAKNTFEYVNDDNGDSFHTIGSEVKWLPTFVKFVQRVMSFLRTKDIYSFDIFDQITDYIARAMNNSVIICLSKKVERKVAKEIGNVIAQTVVPILAHYTTMDIINEANYSLSSIIYKTRGRCIQVKKAMDAEVWLFNNEANIDNEKYISYESRIQTVLKDYGIFTNDLWYILTQIQVSKFNKLNYMQLAGEALYEILSLNTCKYFAWKHAGKPLYVYRK